MVDEAVYVLKRDNPEQARTTADRLTSRTSPPTRPTLMWPLPMLGFRLRRHRFLEYKGTI